MNFIVHRLNFNEAKIEPEKKGFTVAIVMGTIVHSGKELRDYVFTVGLVLTSMHYARRWSLAVINSMPIIPQASGKQYKPRSRNKKKNRGVQCHMRLSRASSLQKFEYFFPLKTSVALKLSYL